MRLNRILKIKDSETKTLFKNSSWVLSSNLIRAVLLFLRGIIVARTLGVELYGTFNLIAAFATMVIQLLSFPISSTLTKFGAEYLIKKNFTNLAAVFKLGTFISFGLAFLSIVLIGIMNYFFYDVFLDDPDLETYVMVFAIIGSTVFFDQLGRSFLRLNYKFKQEGYIVIITAVFDLLLVGITVYLYPADFMAFFIALMISKLFTSTVLNVVSFYSFKRLAQDYMNTKVEVLKEELRDLSNYTLANSGSRILKTITNNGDVLLLGALAGPVPVAFYNIAKKLAQVIMIVVDPFASSIFPQLSILISKKKFSEVLVMVKKVTKLLLLPSIIFVIISILIREQVIELAFGEEYIDAASPFVYLVINSILSALLFWNRPLVESINLVSFRFYLNAVCLLVGGVFAFFSIQSLGAVGVAIGLLIANGLTNLVSSIVAYRKTNNQIDVE